VRKINARLHMRNTVQFVALAMLFLATSVIGADQKKDQLDRLNKALLGQVMVIRNFYVAPTLTFLADGTLVNNGGEQDWTRSELEVDKIRFESNSLMISGHKANFAYDSANDDLKSLPQKQKASVTIQFQSATPTDQEIKTALDHVFVRREELESVVPPDARNLVRVGGPCPYDAATVPKVMSFRGPILPPRVISNPDPVYSDYARSAHIEGNVVLWGIVDVDGRLKCARVAHALGYGLDEQAIHAVKQWRFHPASKAGNPVPVQINIEIGFRLY